MIKKNFDNETIKEISGLTNQQVDLLRKLMTENPGLTSGEAVKLLYNT
jgi:hypothetical protein